MRNSVFSAAKGRGKTDFLIKVPQPFFSNKGYRRIYPVEVDIHGFMRLRCYALEKFSRGAPVDLLTWLRQYGGVYAINVVSAHDKQDDAPSYADEYSVRLMFGDPTVAMLFKLTFVGAS